MESWCQEWLLKFNPSKCKVMHIGLKVQTGYYVEEEALTRKLDETTEEKDLGICLTEDLKAIQKQLRKLHQDD